MIAQLSKETSILSLQPFHMRLILRVIGYSSSAWYETPQLMAKRKPAIGDAYAIELIGAQIDASKFHGEGYLKVARKMAKHGNNVSKHRETG